MPLPQEVYQVLVEVVEAMREGKAITLLPRTQRLTTQEAADFIGISRPTLVKLLEDGKIPYDQPGRHRRILFTDLLAYQERRREDRRAAAFPVSVGYTSWPKKLARGRRQAESSRPRSRTGPAPSAFTRSSRSCTARILD